MKQKFEGWGAVSKCLKEYADNQQMLARSMGESVCRLNLGQRASIKAIAERITKNGIVIADEVGMGKTRIAVELVRSVIESGGRVAILVPPGLGYQWQAELRDGKVDAPLILRSLWQYLAAWEFKSDEEQHPWFEKKVVVISHAFTNWRLGENTDPWRWALLPEFYALWRKKTSNRLPRGYNDKEELNDEWVRNAAISICNAIPTDEQHPAWSLAAELSKQTPWPGALDGSEYGRNQNLRPWLERAVGLGLGIFDLIVIDEAHKSRGTDSGLSRLLDKVVLSSALARRLAMTATPVELDVSQWQQTLGRIGLDEHSLTPIKQAIGGYAEAVKRVRQCPSTQDARTAYKLSAEIFQKALSPYLLRRDKREDMAVLSFKEYSGQPINDYRREIEITIETATLSHSWRQAVCAAEALSIVTSQADGPVAKRLRLTLGNGHGISTLLDQARRDEVQDQAQNEFDERLDKPSGVESSTSDPKRDERVQWWIEIMKTPFLNGDDALFDHPAILAAVKAIEEVAGQGEKVLVFGRFTRPLRALVDLLNAREMLRSLQNERLWPQAKIHGDPSDDMDHSEWPALRAAHRQLQNAIPLEQIDQILNEQYKVLENQRKKLRHNLMANIEQGFLENATDHRAKSLFSAFNESVKQATEEDSERHPLALVSKALHDLLGDQGELSQPVHYADAFSQLINALSDRGEGDSDGDGELDKKLWSVLEERLREEYNRPQGGFSRLMYGGTKPETRRLIQLAFNRPNSFPKVLVAQSMVGREGLNLHKACRTVVLLHPEWNPGVVEQQIGRVDRVGSHWALQLKNAIRENRPVDELPRIEVCPVIFKGTYDEHNWKILCERWDDLRAQLHGIVIPSRHVGGDQQLQKIVDEIAEVAPNFSPSCG